jgi:hypothetical protein
MAAPQQYSGRGFILGGVTDETPDWLGSYTEGVEGAQRMRENELRQQEARQRMAENAAAEQRRAATFANEQADRARLEQAWAGQGGLPGLQTPEGPALGPMEPMNIPAPRAPSAQYAEELAPVTPRGAGAITRDEYIKLLPEWARLEQAEGLPNNYLEAISMLESSGGVNTGTGQFTGIFQIGPEVAKDFGVTPEQLRDPRVNAQVAAKLAGRNARLLRARLNREPQPWELYLAHQQGAGGAASLLQNPNGNVVDVLAGAYGGDRARAQQAVIQNGGDPNMTAGEFAQLWAQKFSGALPQPFTGGPGLQVEGEAPPSMVATPSPTASPLRNDINEFLAKRNRRDVYFGIIDQLRESPLRGVYDYLFSDQATAERNAAQSAVRAEALQWYQSDAAGAFFDANPAALVEAQRDPIAFYQQNSGAVAGAAAEPTGKTDLPAGVMEPAAPAPTVPTAPLPTPGVQTQPVTDQQALAAAQGIAADIVPSVTAEDFAGISAPGQGTMTQQIMRTPRGQVPVLPDSGLYIAEPAKINADMNELMVARQSLERRYNDALRFRDRETMAAIEDKVVQIDAGIRLMQNMQSIAALQGGDVTQISQTLSRLTNGQTRIQPRSDGTFNIYQNGQMAYEAVPQEALIASLRSMFDTQYQAQVAARATAAAEMEKEILKGDIETRREVVKRQADMYKELAIKNAEQQYNSDPANAEYSATTQTMADGNPVLILTPKRGGLPPQIWMLEPDIGVDGQPIMGPDGAPKLNWKQQSTSGISAVPVQ